MKQQLRKCKNFFFTCLFPVSPSLKKKEGKKYFVKMQAQWQKKRAEIWNPSIVYSKGQINHYFGNWKGDTPQDILQSGALYYIPPSPSPAPEAKVAKTDNDSMKGSRIGLLGQTISIIHHSVDLLFFRVQCKQAPSCEVFTGEPLEASLVAQLFACHARDHLWCRRSRFHPWFGKIPWSRKWQPTPVFLPGESHGQRSWQDIVHGVAKNQT